MKYTAFAELINCADLAFVAGAVSKDDARPQFWYMSVRENEGGLSAMATDGRRLHKAQLNKRDAPNVSPGYWRVLKNKMFKMRDYDLEHEMRADRFIYERKHVLWLARLDKFDFFPADDVINRIAPQGDPAAEGKVIAWKYQHGSMNALIKNLPESAGINLEYLKDLGPWEWNYKVFAPGKPFLFECENKTALIMPLNLD
jgi:hypothetical protein